MGIQSSVNGLIQQLYTIGAIGAGLREQKKQTKGQEKTANEAQIQTEIAAGNAPMKDGKVDTEWLKKRRDEMYKRMADDYTKDKFDNDGKLSERGKMEAQWIYNQTKKGVKFGDKYVNDFYNDTRVQNYIKSFNEKNARFESALDQLESAISPELQNEVARKVAKMSVKSRTNNINKTKADFKKHLIGVKKDKGSELS